MTRPLRILLARVRGLLHRDAIAQEIREELRIHMEMRTEEYERRGLPPEAARQQARRRVGNLAVHQDRGYDVRGGGVMETIVQDIRYSVRLLLKQRGFAVVAIVTLALAIGAVTAVVSVIDATMLRPLPYPNPEQLVDVTVSMPQPDGRRFQLGPSLQDLHQWQESGDVFSAVAMSRSARDGRIVHGERPERVEITEVTEQYLAMYGVVPLYGRDFNADDMLASAPPVVILGHGYWQSRLGGDPDVVGEAIRIGDSTATVAGVLPPGLANDRILRPLHLSPDTLGVGPDWYARRGTGATTNGRLKPGITMEQATEKLSASLEDVPGPEGSVLDVSAVVTSRLEEAIDDYSTTIEVLAGAVAFVLLLACVNVAGLQLARGTVRQPELAVRASLGAGRGRIVRLLMIESFVLAIAGAVTGLALAWLALDGLVANLPLSLPSNVPVTLNFTVLAVAIIMTVVTAVLFGLVPALHLSSAAVGSALANAGRRHGPSLSPRSAQLLMTAEIALAVVLVAGAALMLRSFARIMSVDVGFDPDAIVTMEVVPLATDAATHQQYYPGLVRQLRLIRGIEAAGAVDNLPLKGSSTYTNIHVGDQRHFVEIRETVPGYFEALGMPVVAGRTLTDADYSAAANLTVLNESAARELFPGTSAIGRSLTTQRTDDLGDRHNVEWEVIGVVGDVRHGGPLRDSGTEAFFPFRASESDAREGEGLIVVVRPGAPIPDLADRLRGAAEAVGPRVLVESVRSGSDWLGDRVIRPRQRTVLLSLLGGLGLALALVGVFGITAYAVARRTREIGVRMTFGARPHQVVGRIVRDAAVPVGAGIVVGLLGAVAATRVIESFLFETAPTDPGTFAIVAVILGVTGCVAAWIPARRAVRIDPVSALRTE